MMAQRNITDRAKRYRAQNNVTGPRKCVLCGSRSDIQVMHLSGNENDGERANLAYGCRSCNGKLSAAFKRIGAGRRTAQYNPAAGIPTYEQYKWAVVHHNKGEHDEGGAVIHATPKHKRIQYAKMIARETAPAKRETFAQRRRDFEDRYNPGTRENLFGFGRPDARRTTPATGGIAHHMAKAGKRAAGGASSGSHKGYKISRTADGEYFSSLDPQSLFETKRGATALIDSYLKGRGNPSKFDRCVRDVKAKGGAGNAYAVCTAAGTRNNPTIRKLLRKLGLPISEADNFDYLSSADKERFKRELQAKLAEAERDQAERRAALKRRNPADASAKVFEEFHGFEPREVVTVTKKIHHHSNLAAAGELKLLKIWGVDEQGHSIQKFKGALLAFNEDKNQLFVEGGDQRVNLDDFGISKPHELETLGVCTYIGYDTDKTHLRKEGGKALYVHKFRTTNDNGRHVVVKYTRYPDLIYDVRNEQLLFSGGSYEILAEGINQ